MSIIFLGMPVFNGEKFISQAIKSIINQKYTNWELLISDNASTDHTGDICQKYSKKDKRITYFRQKKNIGAPNNFNFLLLQATSKYFAWMAADDLWHPEFLQEAMEVLRKNKTVGLFFCNVANIDSFRQIIRFIPSFTKFMNKTINLTILRYILDPEILGKANLIYSVYRLEVCKKAWELSPLSNDWGIDMSFVLSSLSFIQIFISEKVLFYKRLSQETDKKGNPRQIMIKNPSFEVPRLKDSLKYSINNIKSVKRSYSFPIFILIILIRFLFLISIFLLKLPYFLHKKFLN